MRSLRVFLTVVFLSMTVVVVGCTQASPAPTAAPAAPTKAAQPAAAPAAPTKAAEPTKAAAPAAPTAAPVKKVAFPESGKAITYIVPYATGGSTDITARLLAPYLEKELGVPIQIVNKPGASTQLGSTELATAKPDGYTIGTFDLPSGSIAYMLPDRKAVYNRQSFQPLWMLYGANAVWWVRVESPYKSVKDVVDAAKARPEEINNGDAGLLTGYHLSNVTMQQVANIKMNLVHFEGSGPATTATVGGHTDIATVSFVSGFAAFKSGQTRAIGTMAPKRDPLFPDVPTFEEQGYKVRGNGPAYFATMAPAGIPKDVQDVLVAALQKVTANPEVQKRAQELSINLLPMNPIEVGALWDELDAWAKDTLPLAVEQNK